MEKRLGRGLSALIPDTPEPQTTSSEKQENVINLKIDNILPSPYQPREKFTEVKLRELIASIKEKGVIQPIIVRPLGDGRYELISGERRLRAVKTLSMNEIPALIRQVKDSDALELSLIENIQREELNPIEEAQAYKRLCDEFNFTQEKIGQTIGKERSTITNLMRLLLLPKEIQNNVSNGTISMGHARTILSIDGEKAQTKLCQLVIKKGLSVRQVELLAKKFASKQPKRAITKDHNVSAIEEELQHLFGTRVRVSHGKKRGKIEIQYYSNDDLERILNIVRK
ncbi:MAG: hypothetical protein COS99_07580 [Candidatus Omnitrophica bacterium CG07_land_8_20_14_0_80_42_15]|uniref:ParB-like N-terminal domain-containing protein n=1 Tax=Candidatus Aquitaenariimonas noxiae TaxID=1974741 RepID=A0A2J0KQY1_9BACT|nr:MAG: hypothetical protein COS99_07580 [Candidatus Omnitrophica bacterium CG07_land_8_20_14_0_80_42_15]